MDLPPPLPARPKRFQGWWRVGLCMAVLVTIVSATQNGALLDNSFAPLVFPGGRALQRMFPHLRDQWIGWRICLAVGLCAPLLATLLSGVVGGVVSVYVAVRWRPTPRATGLTSYALFWPGTFMGLGLALRWYFGEQVVTGKTQPFRAEMLLWPAGLFVLSGCYAWLFRQGSSSLPSSETKP